VIVLDTHAWVWWVGGDDRLGPGARGAIDRAERIGVCTISCWELATAVARDRIRLDRAVTAWVRQALAHPRVHVLSLSPDVAIGAALLDRNAFPRDPADRIIYATARSHGVPLVTRDKAITGFDPQRAVW